MCLCFFFFFQAEDGIRDRDVTGVQTCTLPIWPPAELPARMRGYGKLDMAPPDWRITCFFVDRDRRGEGIAKAALQGALRIIATKGGGTVDGYPIAIPRGKPYSNNFLWSGAASMFSDFGFRRLGNLGSSKLVVRRIVR